MVYVTMERAFVRMVGRAMNANFAVVKYGKDPLKINNSIDTVIANEYAIVWNENTSSKTFVYHKSKSEWVCCQCVSPLK